MKNPWYDINFHKIDTPALLVDKEKVKHNIRRAIEIAGGVNRLRPHVKTHKTLEVARLQIKAGVYKFKCATIAEAEMLGMAGAKDVLLAYPVQGPKIERVFNLIKKFPETKYSVLIDNAKTAQQVDRIAQAYATNLSFFIDANNGQNRTGVPLEQIPNLVDDCSKRSHLILVGLHCYDGHIRMPDFEERSKACRQAFEPVEQLRQELEKSVQKKLVLIAGGSPSFSVHAKYHNVECSPGTFIFWDERYARDYKEQAFEKAAVLATRVISKLNANTYCLDLGHKSVASEFPFPRIAFMHPEMFVQIGHSEEHLVLKSEKPDILEPGELLLGYPYHICPTVALYDSIHVVSNGQVLDHWAVIARNRKITV